MISLMALCVKAAIVNGAIRHDCRKNPMDLTLKPNGFDFEIQWFHFFIIPYYICRVVTYSFTITYLEYFMAGNFGLKISTTCTIH